MRMANEDIRNEIKNAGLYMWHIADGLGISDTRFSVKLRHELPLEEKDRIRQIIKELREG